MVPDLVGHGRSTGLHAYITSVRFATQSVGVSRCFADIHKQMDQVVDGLNAAICDVHRKDLEDGQPAECLNARKRFLLGASLGGCVVLHYML